MGIIFGYTTDGAVGLGLYFVSILLIMYSALIAFKPVSIHAIIPESAYITGIGMLVGIFVSISDGTTEYIGVSQDLYNYILFPPIIFNSGYFLQRNLFFSHFIEILILSLVNTIFNIILVAGFLYALQVNFKVILSPLDVFIYATILSPIDTAQALEILAIAYPNDEELIVLITGESTFNHVVSVAMFEALIGVDQEDFYNPLGMKPVLLSFLRLIVLMVGGAMIGILITIALMKGLRYSEKTPHLRPLAHYIIGGSAYGVASCLLFSGPVAILVSGMMLGRYDELKLYPQTQQAFVDFAQGVGYLAQMLLFFLFGVSAIEIFKQSRRRGVIDIGFIFSTIFICFIVRFLTMLGLIPIINLVRPKSTAIGWKDTIIMGYSGTRGVVSILLALDLPESFPEYVRYTLLYGAVIEILVSQFFQGLTMKFLINALKISRANHFYPSSQIQKDALNILAQPLYLAKEGVELIPNTKCRFRNKANAVIDVGDGLIAACLVSPKHVDVDQEEK